MVCVVLCYLQLSLNEQLALDEYGGFLLRMVELSLDSLALVP